MSLHVKLDFTAPHVVGNTVYTVFPPGDHQHNVGPASYDFLEGKITSIKFELELNHDNSCVVKEPVTEKELSVKAVMYTIVPLPKYHLSAFTIECFTEANSHPMIFSSEDELKAYQAPKESSNH